MSLLFLLVYVLILIPQNACDTSFQTIHNSFSMSHQDSYPMTLLSGRLVHVYNVRQEQINQREAN